MNTPTTHSFFLTSMVFALSGCMMYATPRTNRGSDLTTAEQSRTVQPKIRATTQVTVTPKAVQPVYQAQPSTGVLSLNITCQTGATETCNGLDDNCNGQIDEGCGYQSGQAQITLKWDTQADLDLYITDPKGEEIHYKHPKSQSGGYLDYDARGGCDSRGDHLPIENAYWEQAIPGTYTVRVRYWSGSRCSTSSGSTTATISISINGQTKSYRATFNPNDDGTVLTFTM